MTNPQRLDNIDIIVRVLQLDEEMVRTALIGHVLQSLIDEDEIAFPITSVDQLTPLFERTDVTPFPDPESDVMLGSPDPADVPPALFPIGNIDDFLLKTLAFIRFIHEIGGHGKIG